MRIKLNYLLLILSVCLSGISYAQVSKTKSDRTDYDNIYFTDSDTLQLYSDEFTGLEGLDSAIAGYKVFMTGENHTYTESNARLWLKMIKYLHKNAGVRNIMFEYGYSYGWLVNEYLQTGDTVLYNSIKNFAYIEYSNAIKDLYEFNSSLDSSEKIYLAAIDIERGIYPIAKLLDFLLPDSMDAHDSIVIHVQSIQSLASYNDSKLEENDDQDYVGLGFTYRSSSTMQLVQENFKKFESHYEAILGENFNLFKEVITNKFDARTLWSKYDEEKAVQQYVYRETYMHKQFLAESAEHPGSWFGQFGRCHTTQERSTSNSCDWYHFNSLANRIKNTKGGAYKDSVMTIGIIYQTDRTVVLDNVEVEDEFDKYFSELPENGIVLLDFSEDEILDSVYSPDFNYLFLNTNNKRGEVYDYLEYYDYSLYDNVVKVVFHVTQRQNNLSNLNKLYEGTSSPSGFGDEPLVAIELSVLYGTSYAYDGVRSMTGTSFGYYLQQNIELTAGPKYTLSGFYFKDLGFYNLLPRIEFLDIMPGIGLGYERLKLSVVEEGTDPTVGMGFIGDMKNTIYVNPAITLDFLLRTDINISIFTLGAQAGYTIDLSKKQWRSGGELISSTPSTSMAGLSTSFYFGFNF